MIHNLFALTALALSPQSEFAVTPPSSTFVPSVFVEMDDDNEVWEFRLDTNASWTSFSSHSDSTYRLFIASGDVIDGYQLEPGSNTLYVRGTIGNPAPLDSVTWTITMPADQDGTDQYPGSTGRTWSTLSSSEIAYLDGSGGGDRLARVGYGAQDTTGEAQFERARLRTGSNSVTKGEIYYVSPSAAGAKDGSLDEPDDISALDSFDWLSTNNYERVVLLEGDYTGSGYFRWDSADDAGSSGARLELIGAPGAVVKPTGSYAGAKFEVAEYWLIQGLEFDLSHSDADEAALVVRDGDHIHIDSCELYSGKGSGIVIGADATDSTTLSTDITVSNCEIYDFHEVDPEDSSKWLDRIGILIQAGSENVCILGNHIYQNSGDGIQVSQFENASNPTLIPAEASNIEIIGNRIHDDRENAIDLKSSSDVLIEENLIYGYTESDVASPASPAVKIHHGAYDVVVSHNQIVDCLRGVDMSNGSENWSNLTTEEDQHYPDLVVVSHNFISGADTDADYGIIVQGSDNVSIVNNEVREFDGLIEVKYAPIDATNDTRVATVTPTPEDIVNNVLIDPGDGDALYAGVVNGSGVRVTWPVSTAHLTPNAFMDDSDEAWVTFNMANVTSGSYTRRPTEWASYDSNYFGTSGSFPFQSDDSVEYVSGLDLQDWLYFVENDSDVDDLVQNANGSVNMDWDGEGRVITGITDRRGSVTLIHIGVF